MLKTQNIDYRDDEVILEGYLAYEDTIKEQQPAILVCHDWSGKNDFACRKAEKLTELGYIGFALDMYGKGKVGNTKEEKIALMQPLLDDRAALSRRIFAAFDTLRNLGPFNPTDIGAIGFCFGGLCVLDLARSGVDVKGVVSFHGLLHEPTITKQYPIRAKILALHGFDDPMVTPQDVIAFGEAMRRAQVDWQVNMYGNAMHAFTNPQVNDPGFGTVYNKTIDARSWIAMKEFFKEVFEPMARS